MGRVGTLHAWEQEGVVPSIQTIGKGLGGGYVPIAGILVGHDVIKVLDDGTGSVSGGCLGLSRLWQVLTLSQAIYAWANISGPPYGVRRCT